MSSVQKTYVFTPSADIKRIARQKFYAALDKRREMTPVSVFLRLISRPATWATVVVVLVLAIVGTTVIRPAISPPMLVSSPEGNFAFLISDEANDIGDFENLYVTISKVGLQATGSGKWIEFEPETKTIDLTQLLGEQSQEIWRGDLPEGQYSQVFIYVSKVSGKLKATGQTIDVKLPSNKLQMSKSFEITADTITSFTFDITVISAGNNGEIHSQATDR
jgi:hypothetical protein